MQVTWLTSYYDTVGGSECLANNKSALISASFLNCRFAFFTVVGLDEAKKMCSELHKTKLDGRELVVQVSYVSTSESVPAIEPAIPEEVTSVHFLLTG